MKKDIFLFDTPALVFWCNKQFVSEMIESVQLPDIHKDPFDRLLIIPADTNNAKLVTKDVNVEKYEIPVFWI